MSAANTASPDTQSLSLKPSKLSLSILGGLGLGIFCGLFLGEYCAGLKVIGDIFIGFLRMTVLPYIAVTLVANLGRLSLLDSKRLARIGGGFLLLFWSIGLLAVFILPQTFPSLQTGSFFSSSLTDPPEQTSFLSLLVPSNVFSALANDQIPAVILLCLAAGVSLSRTKKRRGLIKDLDVLASVLMKVTKFIVRFTPLAIFAIAASTVGTLSLEEAFRLQAYFLVYTAGAVLLGGIVLPMLVTSFSPIRYGELLWASKDAILTAFVTGKLIIVLPTLIEQTEALLKQHVDLGEEAGPTVDVLYPLAYPFPHVGKLLRMLFIPFAAWFLGNAMDWEQYPAFLMLGLVSYFGGPIVATPVLLDWAHLPHDMFQLFLFAGVYGERVGDALGAMHLMCFTLLTTCVMRGAGRFSVRGLIRYLGTVSVCLIALVVSVRFTLSQTVSNVETKSEIIAKMQLLEAPVEATIVDEPAPNPYPLLEDETLLERIRRRGVIRVGFSPGALPFSYFNSQGELVGFDVNLAHTLASDLAVDLEFVYYDPANLVEDLEQDHFDIAISGIVGTIKRAEEMQHTPPYFEVHMAFVVPDFRARKFVTYEQIRQIKNLRIGIQKDEGFEPHLKQHLPNAEFIELPSSGDFYSNKALDLDCLVTSAEGGSAYTLLYPDYEVVIPKGDKFSLPLFFAIGNRDAQFRDYMEHWLILRKDDQTIESYYKHWILGRTQVPQKPRWCIIRDVLGWVR